MVKYIIKIVISALVPINSECYLNVVKIKELGIVIVVWEKQLSVVSSTGCYGDALSTDVLNGYLTCCLCSVDEMWDILVSRKAFPGHRDIML